MNVVICGAGVIGASIAYFLAERGVAATLVERHGVACAACGKSGGFTARDWCEGQPQARTRTRAWLTDVLGRIAALPHTRVHELSPGNWKAARNQILAA